MSWHDRGKGLGWRLAATAAALAVWFWTQALLGGRPSGGAGIGDGLHRLCEPVHRYLESSPRAADALLITSSAGIDALALFLLGSWVLAGKLRPFLGLALLLGLRQLTQALCALPPPPGMIWHDPGVPSLLVTYGVANDFFFSGHTAIAVFGSTELARLGRGWAVLGALLAVFEIFAVVALRAHYTMDVFAGILAALTVAAVAEPWSARIAGRFRSTGSASGA